MSASPRSRSARRLVVALAVMASGLALSACQEVASNVRDAKPYKVEPIEGTDIQRVRMDDETAALIPVETATVRKNGQGKTVAPHLSLIYNPDGDAFVYTKPKPQTYVREPIEIDRVTGDRLVMSDGPAAGTAVVTLGAAELLATEYEILNQHP